MPSIRCPWVSCIYNSSYNGAGLDEKEVCIYKGTITLSEAESTYVEALVCDTYESRFNHFDKNKGEE